MNACKRCGQSIRWLRARDRAVPCVPEEVVEWVDEENLLAPEQITVYCRDGAVITGRRVSITARTAREARGYIRHMCAKYL